MTLGPWGHGKTSFIDLMREQCSKAPVLTVVAFNPWMFSGPSQLVSFFLAASEVGDRVDD